MNKKGRWLWLSVGLVVALIIAAFFYFALFNPRNEGAYRGVNIANPALNLTMQEAIQKFDESFVFYLLYSIKAYNLHNPPLSRDTPKIEIIVENDAYNAVINKGIINVNKGAINNEDIVIRTTKEEAVKMMKDKNYVTESFNEGKSAIELIASKTTLFAKGYLSIYTELTGKSVTGNVVRIYNG